MTKPSSPPAPDEVAESLLAFWFSPAVRSHWFASTDALDTQMRERYEALWQRGARGELRQWEDTARGALALVILLDQLPLNMFRGQAQSFSTEQMSREVAQRALNKGFERQLREQEQAFLFMPFMHSERIEDQDRAVALFEAAGLTQNLKWARHHREVVRRFGRFPHRNAILGRPSSAAERAYLASDEAFHG